MIKYCLRNINNHNVYVALRIASSGDGYPYDVTVDNAYDFQSVEAAMRFLNISKSWGQQYEVVTLMVTHTVLQVHK